MKDTLYDQLLKAITNNCYVIGEYVNGTGAAAKACQTISEEWAKGQREEWAKGQMIGFAEWIREHCQLILINNFMQGFYHDGEVKTIDDLIQLYKNSEHGKH